MTPRYPTNAANERGSDRCTAKYSFFLTSLLTTGSDIAGGDDDDSICAISG